MVAFWVALSRDTLRYDFFIGPALAFFTAIFIEFLSIILIKKLKDSEYITDKVKNQVPFILLKIGITLLLLTPLLFCTPAAHTKRTMYVAKHMRLPIPGDTPIEKAFRWMKSELSNNAVVAASWIYGSQLNVLGRVKTIIDQDHFIQHWIYLYNRYVFCSYNDSEALEFLKTHTSTHIMLTKSDILSSDIHAFVSNQINPEKFKPILLQIKVNKVNTSQRLVTSKHNIPFKYIDVPDRNKTSDFLTARLNDGQDTTLPFVALYGKQRIISPTQSENRLGGVVLYFDNDRNLVKAYYIAAAGWNSLAIRLYFFGHLPNIFIPIYPTDKNTTADVMIWEIRYPPNIKTNLKFLALQPGE